MYVNNALIIWFIIETIIGLLFTSACVMFSGHSQTLAPHVHLRKTVLF